MRKIIRALLGLAACSVLVCAGTKLAAYLQQSKMSGDLNGALVDAVVAETARGERLDEARRETGAFFVEVSPIEVDFDALWETNADVIGWIYCEDTPINLPVVQAEDNAYYLHRLIDGRRGSAGTLFADYRCAEDFSGSNTIVYGHSMKDKSMFGTLSNYKHQAYFDEHPVAWLLAPDASYKVEWLAGCVLDAESDIYALGQSSESMRALAARMMEQSTFESGAELTAEDRFLTLSTCSYEYENARFVLIGRLTQVA